MNIAIFTDTFLPNVNGIVTSIIDSSKALAKKGHNVIIFAPKVKFFFRVDLGKNIEVKFINGIKAFFYDGFRLTFPATPYFVKRLIDFKADIIHFHTQFSLGSEAIMTAKILRKPLVGTFHTYIADPGYLKHVKLDNLKAVEDLTWIYSNFFYNRCNLVLSPSKKTAKVLKQHKVKKAIKVLPNCIDFSGITILNEKEKVAIRKKYDINDKTIVFVGRVAHEKNIGALVESFNIVKTKISDAKLLIIGDGPQLKDLKRSCGPDILFKGMMDNKLLKKSGLLSACSVFATMSETENQPMTIIEAMASGLPIVGVNKLGVPEMIKGNGFCAKAGSVKDFSSKLITMLDNKKINLKFSRKSLELSQNYSSEKIAELLEKTYTSLIRQR